MSTSVADPLIGQVVDGRYRVEARLAAGGMATVYRATDLRLDRAVALKVMHSHLADDARFVSRFAQEARAAARISHPHVVAVYDQGRDDRVIYLAMEYVGGRTLRDVVYHEAPLTPRHALGIMAEILDGLTAAHRVGLVHRDLKPENVLLGLDGAVRIADFGLARAATTATSSSTVIGTVAYLSPELVAGGDADERSDVYAAGIMLFELLTGRQPFTGDTPIQVAYQHVNGTVPAPSSLEPGLAGDLDELVQWACGHEPSTRPDNAAQLLEQVTQVAATLDAAALDRPPTGLPLAGNAMTGRPDAGPDAVATAPVAPRQHTESLVGGALLPAGLPTEPLAGGAAPTAPDRLPETARPARRAARRRRRTRALAAGALVLVLAATAVWFFSVGPGGHTATPGVVGRTERAATAVLREQGLRTRTTQVFDDRVPSGSVVATDPRPGRRIRNGGTVLLSVSQGPQMVSVPTVTGESLDQARSRLAAATLAAGDVTEQWSETVAEGRVIAQDPRPGTTVRHDTGVGLVVSRGREPIPVPDLTGRPVADARADLDRSGLVLATAAPVFSDTVPEGRIVSQRPGDGTLHRGDRVTVVVSRGPDLVAVPDVTGRSSAEAEQALRAAGFQVQEQRILGGFFDRVRSTDPAAGTQAKRGSTVTVTIV